ncbi:hypothetical protein TNCV_4587611 [Trichonephila clavipes]|uniref:Uncharacterized protein n=1 Tax=Trichonephila clavipes TaxID=2585209 RepID=A0A8X6S2A3_TRICX|nr:hypothetical protein TNCV_4587611 [Trichonephila clavipes]
MTTITYRGHSAVGVRPFFPSRQYSGVWLRLGARGTMITLYFRVRAAVGARHLFSIEALLCCPIVSCCTRNDDNDILPRTRDGGFSYPFFVEAQLYCPIASWCTRNDVNFMLPRPRGAGVCQFFPSRHYSAVRLRLGARGTMITTSYRVRAAVGVRHLFPSRHYSAVRSHLGARGTMTTITYRRHSAVGVRPFFSVEAILWCPVASCCKRNDDNDILPQPLGGGCSSLFSRHNSTVRSRLGARGTMTTTSYRGRATVGVRNLFPSRHYSAVRLRLGARGTMITTSYCVRAAVGVRHLFRRGTTLLSGGVLLHAER